jgi:hypothetical protein
MLQGRRKGASVFSETNTGPRNEEINARYSSRILRWVWRLARMGERRGECRVLVGKPVGKRLLGRPRRSWEGNTKTDRREVEWGGGTDWIDLAQDRGRWRAHVNAVMNHRIPYSAGNFLSSFSPVSFSGRTLLDGVN